MKRQILLLLILFLVAACGPAIPVDDKGVVLSDDTIIIYSISGGFAGLVREWTLFPDGRIDQPDGRQTQIDPAQIQALFDEIRTADFRSFNESYIPEDACCDMFTYTLTIQTGSETQTVSTMDEAPHEPEALTAVLQTINDIIQPVE